jgi:hypothetical protein
MIKFDSGTSNVMSVSLNSIMSDILFAMYNQLKNPQDTFVYSG